RAASRDRAFSRQRPAPPSPHIFLPLQGLMAQIAAPQPRKGKRRQSSAWPLVQFFPISHSCIAPCMDSMISASVGAYVVIATLSRRAFRSVLYITNMVMGARIEQDCRKRKNTKG